MNRLIYLATLTFFTALFPGIRCLYRGRLWSAALFFVANLAVVMASLSVYRGQTLVSVEVLLFSIVIVYGAHAVLLSASLAAAAQRRVRSRTLQKIPVPTYAELMPTLKSRIESAPRLSTTNPEQLEQA